MTSDHFDGRHFFNLRGATGQPASALPRLVATPRTPWPSRVAVTPQRPPPLEDCTAVVSFIGHSSFLIQTRFGNLLTDPVYSERASPLTFIGPRRVRAPAVRFDDLPPISVVLLSHNHYDHCDLRTLRALDRRSRPLIVTPLGNRRLLQSAGLGRVEELDWWQHAVRAPLPIMLTPAQHFSARTPFDRNRALWGGFVVGIGQRRIFFAGDSGYAPHFREVRGRVGPVALALLPIGAYEPRWFMKDIHMNPEEAVQAHLDLDAERSIGMHFGTFQLTPEGIDEPVRALAAARRDRGVADSAFVTLDSGGSLRVR
jgi:L-ascorbate metabolism protein UlaG (beta-lactamase superfamily)